MITSCLSELLSLHTHTLTAAVLIHPAINHAHLSHNIDTWMAGYAHINTGEIFLYTRT